MATKKNKPVTKTTKPVIAPQRLWWLTGAIVLGVAIGVLANKFMQPSHDEVMPPLVAHISDEQAIDFTTMARKVLPTLRKADGSLVGEETEAEKAQPVVPLADSERAINAGFVSAIAQYCGMDWRSNANGFLNHYRDAGYSERQMAFMGFLHNFAMGQFADRLDYSCSPAAKEDIRKGMFK